MKYRCCSMAVLWGVGLSLHAQDAELHAYADERLVAAPADSSWTRGGFGKTRYGSDRTQFHLGGAAVYGALQISPALLALGQLQYQTSGHSGFSLLEGWLRYRPVSTTAWRWSVKAGVFFPPVSMENDGIGWTSPWTLSASAINTWAGEELRATGGEWTLEHRGQTHSWDLRIALFRRDDPAGTVLAARGWSVGDLISGIGSRLREPDAALIDEGATPPRYYDPFRHIGRPHWGDYVAVSWRAPGETRLNLTHYDNRADPGATAPYAGDDEQAAWRTRFWSAGARTTTGAITWIAQAMDGDTVVEPAEGDYRRTRYRAAFVLAGWNRGAWRPALRIEHFSTRKPPDQMTSNPGEHGNAATAALNWRPRDYLRLTAEWLRIDSASGLRAEYGLPVHVIDTQLQLSLRVLY